MRWSIEDFCRRHYDEVSFVFEGPSDDAKDASMSHGGLAQTSISASLMHCGKAYDESMIGRLSHMAVCMTQAYSYLEHSFCMRQEVN